MLIDAICCVVFGFLESAYVDWTGIGDWRLAAVVQFSEQAFKESWPEFSCKQIDALRLSACQNPGHVP
jgi:hypothetical protein